MDYKKEYINFLKSAIDVRRPLKVVFDASNGPAGMLVKDLWSNSPVEAILIHDDIDPDFKAHGPNPLVPGASKSATETILKYKADLGVMFDADGDRAFFLDDKGAMIPACFVAALLFKKGTTPFVADELVYQSLSMLNLFPAENLLPSRIGAYFIKERMRNDKATVGAEYSGHYYFKDFFNADSGMFAAIKVINALSEMKESLFIWKKSFGEHTIETKEIRIEGKDMKSLYQMIEVKYKDEVVRLDKRDGLTFVFDNYWINVRSSNTEPVMRIICGGSGEMRKIAQEIESLIA